MWRTVKLGDVCNISIGKTPSRSDKRYWDKEKQTDNVWLSIADLTSANGRYIWDSKEYVSKDGANLVKPVPKNTLVMSFKLSIGKLAFTQCELRTNEAIAALSVKDEMLISKEYLYHYLSSFNWDVIAGKDEKVKGKTLNKKKLNELKITFPPLAEQQRIVEKLDGAFAEIDRAIEYNQIISQRLKQVIEVTLDEISGLGGVEVRLRNVVSINSSLVNPTREPYSSCLHIGAGNLMSMSNEIINVISAQEENLTSGKYPFDESTVLYSKIRPYLRKVHTPDFTGICSADMYPLTPNPISLQRSFLFYLLLSQKFTSYAVDGSARAGMPKVNQNHLFAYRFLLPSLSEQDAFSRRMDVVMEHTKSAASIYGQRYSAFTSLKSAILAQELQPPTSEAA